jgi:hypothetical protein
MPQTAIPRHSCTNLSSIRVQPENPVPLPKNKFNRKPLAAALLAAILLAPQLAHAQASEIPSAAPAEPAGNSEQRGRAILDQMIAALGGDLWLNRTTMECDGRGTSFFRGEPNPYVSEYHEAVRYAQPKATPPVTFAERVGFLTDRSMILPGKKIDVIQMTVDRQGYEITYKGKTEPPKELVDNANRRRDHSIEAVVHDWIHAPGVMIIYEGQKLIDRRLADQVTILNENNDAVTLDVDSATHLPIRRTFEYRDPQFHDLDEESTTFDDYHTFQGIATPMTITGYHNGEMNSQNFLTKVTYNEPLDSDFFNPDAVAAKLKKK